MSISKVFPKQEPGKLSWRDFLFREKYQGVCFLNPIPVSNEYTAGFVNDITVVLREFHYDSVHSSGCCCVLFLPLTLVLIEVKKTVSSSFSSLRFILFRYYWGGSFCGDFSLTRFRGHSVFCLCFRNYNICSWHY